MSNSGPIIRRATRDDRTALCRLYYEFHEFHVRGVPDRLAPLGDFDSGDWTELLAGLDKILADDNAALFVAEMDGALVGLAEVYSREDEPNPARIAYKHGHLQSLMVLEAFRHHGTGSALVQAAEDWARSKGATEMQLDCWAFAAGPLPFYEKSGYRVIRHSLARTL